MPPHSVQVQQPHLQFHYQVHTTRALINSIKTTITFCPPDAFSSIMSLVSNLLDAIVQFIETAFSKLVDGFSFLESLLGRAASAQPASSLAAADALAAVMTARGPRSEATLRLSTSDSSRHLGTMTPAEIEREHVTQLIAENTRLTRKQDQLQQTVLDLNEYAFRLERDVEVSDSKATLLTRELHHHRQLTISALAMYRNAKHQLAATELRQRVALAYVDELVAKYGRRDDGATSRSRTGDWQCAAAEVIELEEL